MAVRPAGVAATKAARVRAGGSRAWDGVLPPETLIAEWPPHHEAPTDYWLPVCPRTPCCGPWCVWPRSGGGSSTTTASSSTGSGVGSLRGADPSVSSSSRTQRAVASTASIAMANLFSGVYGATYVVFVLRELKLGGEGLAVLGVSMAGGALLGASLTSRVVRLRGPIAVLTLAPFGYGLLMIVAAAPVGNLWLPAGAVFGYAIVSAMSAIAYVTFRQEAADQSAAGRVAAASRAITGGVFSLSAMGAVLLLTLLPARGVVWIAVLGETASVAILVLAGGLTHLQKPRDAGRSLRVKSGGEGQRTDHRS